MTPNLQLNALIDIPEFEKIRQRYRLISVWCRDSIFLFDKRSLVIFQDLREEDETDVYYYDRRAHAATFNMYGIADRVSNPEDKRLDDLAAIYAKNIDFESMAMRTDRKRRSLAFSLALLEVHGETIFREGEMYMNFRENFTRVIKQIADDWERCMRSG